VEGKGEATGFWFAKAWEDTGDCSSDNHYFAFLPKCEPEDFTCRSLPISIRNWHMDLELINNDTSSQYILVAFQIIAL
jgi:hypothetical protein